MCRMYKIALHHEIFVDELSWVDVVCVDATNLGRGDIHLVDLYIAKELLHVLLPSQIKLGPGLGNQFDSIHTTKPPDDGRTHHVAMSGDKNSLRVVRLRHRSLLL